MENRLECIREMDCFVRGGRPGIARLLQVYKTILIHYKINYSEEKYFVINSLGLTRDLQKKMLSP